MSIFQTTDKTVFNQAKWEASSNTNAISMLESTLESADSNQFVLLQLSDGDQRVVNTSQVVPKLQGAADKPDINMLVDFESFKIGANEAIDNNTKATLQLQIGQEEKIGTLEKLFYCINGGLDLYDKVKGKRTDAKEFKKSTDQALGNNPLPCRREWARYR